MGRFIKTMNLKRNVDERGSFTEIMRADWHDLLGEQGIHQANFSVSQPGMIRAWHRHTRGQADIFVVLKGALKVCAYNDLEDEGRGELEEVVLSSDSMQAARVEGRFWHGTKCVSSIPSETVYFVTVLYDPKHPDELRRPWNDKSLVPSVINGNKSDPRAGHVWDWNYPPHK